MEEEEAEILQLHELSYTDLVLLSSPSKQELKSNTTTTINKIMDTLGPRGPGLLAVTGVPNKFSRLRQTLLPLAHKLALLEPQHRLRILKEHNMGSDVSLKNPDRSVSSFAMQLKYMQNVESFRLGFLEHEVNHSEQCDHMMDLNFTSKQGQLVDTKIERNLENDFNDLGNSFKELGHFMMDIGLCLARICDKAIGGQELEQSLLESCAAKGRLIHYHSDIDSFLLNDAERKKGSSKRRDHHARGQGGMGRSEEKPLHKLEIGGKAIKPCRAGSTLWQQWHYDYGIFTVLTDPMFLSSSFAEEATDEEERRSIFSDQECPSPGGHTYLQIFDPYNNEFFMAKAPPESFIIQVGESADILSKGMLRSTLHCVCKPTKFNNICRETFVVFLQPAWSKIFSGSDYVSECHSSGSTNEETQSNETNLSFLIQDIQKKIPPLSSRLKDGMTFAEFSRETTKQYYGGSGVQSNRH